MGRAVSQQGVREPCRIDTIFAYSSPWFISSGRDLSRRSQLCVFSHRLTTTYSHGSTGESFGERWPYGSLTRLYLQVRDACTAFMHVPDEDEPPSVIPLTALHPPLAVITVRTAE